MFLIFIVFLLIICLLIGLSSVRIVPQANEYVIERLGSYYTTWGNGVHFLCPIIDKVARKISLKETVLDFDPQPVITKDNVTMMIDTVVYCRVMDARSYSYGVNNPIEALNNITATTLRNIIGDMELDETLTSRDIINNRMRAIIDEVTDPWGIKCNRCEIKNLMLGQDLQDSMEKQMRAERERREKILQAEGEKKAAILIAEGEKEAMVLRAEAEKAAMIAEAEGQAESMRKIAEAKAEAIYLINDAKPTKEYLALQSYDAFVKAADGQATKIIVPSEIQNVAGTLASITEVIREK